MLRMIECDNPVSAGYKYIETTANFNYNGNNFIFGPMRSSTVKFITREENKLIVQTLNTKYTFEIE